MHSIRNSLALMIHNDILHFSTVFLHNFLISHAPASRVLWSLATRPDLCYAFSRSMNTLCSICCPSLYIFVWAPPSPGRHRLLKSSLPKCKLRLTDVHNISDSDPIFHRSFQHIQEILCRHGEDKLRYWSIHQTNGTESERYVCTHREILFGGTYLWCHCKFVRQHLPYVQRAWLWVSWETDLYIGWNKMKWNKMKQYMDSTRRSETKQNMKSVPWNCVFVCIFKYCKRLMSE